MELLERAPFLRTLAEYAGEARQGSGRMVLVSGESGMGKTVLLEAFQQRTKGARWLWGACDGLLTPRPLGPLFDIGSQLDGELADLCRRQAPRDQLFAAFLAEIDAPAALTVAVMEDVHWADDATIDLLSFLGRRLGRMKALVLATYRDDELGDDHPLRIVLGDLATQRATRRMRLPPLSKDRSRRTGRRSCTRACSPRLRSTATPISPCLPTMPRAPGTRRRCCGTPRRRPGVPPRWVRTANRRRSTSGPCGSPTRATGRLLRRSTRASRVSIRCSTGGRRRRAAARRAQAPPRARR